MICKTKSEATKQAKALRDRMSGFGWKIYVFLNKTAGGWVCGVTSGPVGVSEEGGEYFCLVGEGGHCGNICWTPGERTFKDPNKAAMHAVKCVRRQVNRCIKLAERAEKAVGKA